MTHFFFNEKTIGPSHKQEQKLPKHQESQAQTHITFALKLRIKVTECQRSRLPAIISQVLTHFSRKSLQNTRKYSFITGMKYSSSKTGYQFYIELLWQKAAYAAFTAALFSDL